MFLTENKRKIHLDNAVRQKMLWKICQCDVVKNAAASAVDFSILQFELAPAVFRSFYVFSVSI